MIATSWFKSTNSIHSYPVRDAERRRSCFPGDARAILTPPMNITTVHMYKTHTTEIMVPGDVYIGIVNGEVVFYEFYMRESLQLLALTEVILQHPLEDEVRRSVNAFEC